MKCSNLTRCDKPKIIYFENIFISVKIVMEFMKKKQNILKIF